VDALSEAHDRMPVMIAPADCQLRLHWFRPEGQRAACAYTGGMAIARVSELKQDDVGLIAPLAG
jgi:putative SOS response-associated peptidase YedK